MTNEATIVFAIIAIAAVLMASNRVRFDIIALLVVMALMLSGVLTIGEALAGFSGFGFFSFAPVGLAVLVVAIIYILFIGRKMLLAIQIHRALITGLAPSMIYGMSSGLVRNTATYVPKTIRPWLEYA